MTMFQSISAASDRVMATLVAGLEIEFGRGAGEGLAKHFSAQRMRIFAGMRASRSAGWALMRAAEDDFWLDRVAICGRLDAKWFTATMIVDGDGNAHGMLGCRELRRRKAAREAMIAAH